MKKRIIVAKTDAEAIVAAINAGELESLGALQARIVPDNEHTEARDNQPAPNLELDDEASRGITAGNAPSQQNQSSGSPAAPTPPGIITLAARIMSFTRNLSHEERDEYRTFLAEIIGIDSHTELLLADEFKLLLRPDQAASLDDAVNNRGQLLKYGVATSIPTSPEAVLRELAIGKAVDKQESTAAAANQPLWRSVPRFFYRNAAVILLGMCLGAAIPIIAYYPIGQAPATVPAISAALRTADPTVFAGPENGDPQIVRGFQDRQALTAATDLANSIRSAQHAFDLFAITGTAFSSRSEDMTTALERGVEFRIVLIDHGKQNRANLENYLTYSAQRNDSIETSTRNLATALDVFRHLQSKTVQTGNGKLDVRLWSGPILNSIWIRDAGHPTALGHVEISYYGDGSVNPSVNFGTLSPAMVRSLQDQFNYIWNMSKPAPKN